MQKPIVRKWQNQLRLMSWSKFSSKGHGKMSTTQEQKVIDAQTEVKAAGQELKKKKQKAAGTAQSAFGNGDQDPMTAQLVTRTPKWLTWECSSTGKSSYRSGIFGRCSTNELNASQHRFQMMRMCSTRLEQSQVAKASENLRITLQFRRVANWLR